jgi:hypothetical protein
MSFSIVNYIDDVKIVMQDFDVRCKTAFCAWCLDELFVKVYEFMIDFLGKPIVDKILDDLDKIWEFCIGKNSSISDNKIQKIMVKYVNLLNDSGLDWQGDFASVRESYHHFCAIKFFECFLVTLETQRVNNSELPATCAEYVIDSIDFGLSMVDGVDKPLESTLIKLEVQYQQQMIDFLKNSNQLTKNDRFIIRGKDEIRAKFITDV